MEMPIGIMLINDDYYIEWTNPFLASCFEEDTLLEDPYMILRNRLFR